MAHTAGLPHSDDSPAQHFLRATAGSDEDGGQGDRDQGSEVERRAREESDEEVAYASSPGSSSSLHSAHLSIPGSAHEMVLTGSPRRRHFGGSDEDEDSVEDDDDVDDEEEEREREYGSGSSSSEALSWSSDQDEDEDEDEEEGGDEEEMMGFRPWRRQGAERQRTVHVRDLRGQSALDSDGEEDESEEGEGWGRWHTGHSDSRRGPHPHGTATRRWPSSAPSRSGAISPGGRKVHHLFTAATSEPSSLPPLSVSSDIVATSLHPSALFLLPNVFARAGLPLAVVATVVVGVLSAAGSVVLVALGRYVGGKSSFESIFGSSLGKRTLWKSFFGRKLAGLLLGVYGLGVAASCMVALTRVLQRIFSYHLPTSRFLTSSTPFSLFVIGAFLILLPFLLPISRARQTRLLTRLSLGSICLLLLILVPKLATHDRNASVVDRGSDDGAVVSFSAQLSRPDDPGSIQDQSLAPPLLLLPLALLSLSPLTIHAHARSLRRRPGPTRSGRKSNIRVFSFCAGVAGLVRLGIALLVGCLGAVKLGWGEAEWEGQAGLGMDVIAGGEAFPAVFNALQRRRGGHVPVASLAQDADDTNSTAISSLHPDLLVRLPTDGWFDLARVLYVLLLVAHALLALRASRACFGRFLGRLAKVKAGRRGVGRRAGRTGTGTGMGAVRPARDGGMPSHEGLRRLRDEDENDNVSVDGSERGTVDDDDDREVRRGDDQRQRERGRQSRGYFSWCLFSFDYDVRFRRPSRRYVLRMVGSTALWLVACAASLGAVGLVGLGGSGDGGREGGETRRYLRCLETVGAGASFVGFVLPATCWLILFHFRRPSSILLPSFIFRRSSTACTRTSRPLGRTSTTRGEEGEEGEPLLGASASTDSFPVLDSPSRDAGGQGRATTTTTTTTATAGRAEGSDDLSARRLADEDGASGRREEEGGGSDSDGGVAAEAEARADEVGGAEDDGATVAHLLASKERQLQKRRSGKRWWQDAVVLVGMLPVGSVLFVNGVVELVRGGW